MLSITGITGHSGSYFLQELIQNGYGKPIRCLVRATSDTSMIDQSGLTIEKIIGDLSSDEDIDKITDGADTLIHIASIHWSINVVQSCVRNHVKRVILVHTTGIYSLHKMASDEYKKIEKHISEINVGDMQIIILRPTMIFGDISQDHNIHKFIRMVDKLPLVPEINHGRGLLQPVNARDLGKAYYQIITTQSLYESEYILSGERPISMHELFLMIGLALGKHIRTVSFSLSTGVFLAKLLRLFTFGKINYVERVLRMDENRNFDHAEAARDFAYKPEPFHVGLQREVDEYQKKRNI
ncbi:MAG: NAD(P)H-binding protein [Eubacteriales bacterium]|jgi:nucleoside-diphosphate-sugar epimerase|nr:NAD(P)H-binding protein [Eubacteriales bacterium]